MVSNNYYDVTQREMGDPFNDIGEFINSILLDIKKIQKYI